MLFANIFRISLLALSISCCYTDDSCDPIKLCTDALIQSVSSLPSIPLNHSSNVASSGHIFGIKPVAYHLRLSFNNDTHYTGAVNITVDVSQDTDLLMVNLNNKTLKYSLWKMVIYRNCLHDIRPDVCITKAIYVENLKVLTLTVRPSLLQDAQYVLSFAEFSSYVHYPWSKNGAQALRNFHHQLTSVTYTEMRKEAGSMFPCFDYPAIKATFDLCIEHPSKYLVVSVTKLSLVGFDKLQQTVSADRRTQCFETTPAIPAYTFSFALIRGYSRVNVFVSPPMRIISPVHPKSRCTDAVIRQIVVAVQFMENLTGMPFSFKELDVVMIYSAEWTMPTDNAGLILVDCTMIDNEHQQDGGFHQLFHAIVRQWIGPLISIGHWGEICLQDSLAEYCAWLLQDKIRLVSLDSIVDRVWRTLSSRPHLPWTNTNNVYFDRELNLDCITRGPLVFHTLYERNGTGVIQRFFLRMFDVGKFEFPGIFAWNNAMTYVTRDISYELDNYLLSWFTNKIPLTLRINYEDRNVFIEQNLANDTQQSHIVVQVPVYLSNGRPPFHLVFNSRTYSFTLPESLDWIFFDPHDITPIYKVYNREAYLMMMSKLVSNNDIDLISLNQTKLLRGFCQALYSDQLPQKDDKNLHDWTTVFDYAFNMSADCSCCLTPYAKRSSCSEAQQQRCDKLRLVQQLGYSRNSV